MSLAGKGTEKAGKFKYWHYSLFCEKMVVQGSHSSNASDHDLWMIVVLFR